MIALMALVFGAAHAGAAQSANGAPADTKLRAEIQKRVKVDQDARFAWIKWMQKHQADHPSKSVNKPPREIARMQKVDADNLAWLKKTIAKVGWPGNRMVGKDGAKGAWQLVQHCDADRPFQRQCLELMKAAVARNDADRQDLALLTDRVLVGEGKKQIYGTQAKIANGDVTPSPIEDEANVDKRRAEVGLPPMAEYLKMLKEMYLGKMHDAGKEKSPCATGGNV